MSRPREFDPAEALDRAMKVFWRKGYANTAIEDLVRATGVNRSGLYDEFESKHGLFLASLDHYQATVVRDAFGVVEQAGAGLPEIRAYFEKILANSGAGMSDLGCLMANTATDVAPYDRRAAKKVETFRRRLQMGFAAALTNAKAAGVLSAQVNTVQMADFLTGTAQGLAVLARSGARPKMLANVIEAALSALK